MSLNFVNRSIFILTAILVLVVFAIFYYFRRPIASKWSDLYSSLVPINSPYNYKISSEVRKDGFRKVDSRVYQKLSREGRVAVIVNLRTFPSESAGRYGTKNS